ncbi:MAG: CheR family methyltransferase, partial [Planctomycetota bacterium]
MTVAHVAHLPSVDPLAGSAGGGRLREEIAPVHLGRSASPPLNYKTFQRAAGLLYQLAGITLNDSKQHLVRTRLGRRLTATGAETFEAYLEDHVEPCLSRYLAGQLRQGKDRARSTAATAGACELTHFIDVLSTNLTSFFREPVHFRYLSDVVLPPLLEKRARQGSYALRMWCAGCSSGEEAYSLAATVLEAVRRHAKDDRAHSWDLKILATDISSRVLDRARLGIYPDDRCDQIPAPIRGRYFAPRRLPNDVDCLAAGPKLREAIRFRRLNLLEPWPFSGPFDVVFCRNVMIYFDKQTQSALVNRLHGVLQPGGYLMTGHSESLTGIVHPYVYRQA